MIEYLAIGASGAAMQNLNIMAGLDETSGLRL
jgi:N-acetyl-gamma-glutamyl-phosphate reductase